MTPVLDLDDVACGLQHRLPDGYRALVDDAVAANIFFEPEILTAALEILAPRNVRLCAAAATGETGSNEPRLRAAVPVHRAGGRYGPWPGLQPLATWQHPYLVLGTPLIAAGRTLHEAREALAALLDRAALEPGGPPILLMRQLPEDGAFLPLLHDVLKRTGRRAWTIERSARPGLRVADPASLDMRDLIGAKRLRSIRRGRRRLEKQGALTHRVAVTDADLSGALDQFFALEASGWKGARGTALASLGHDRFTRAFVAQLARSGRVRIDLTLLDDKPIAATLCLRNDDRDQQTWLLWKTGYNETYATYGPGALCRAGLTCALLDEAKAAGTPLSLDSLASPHDTIAHSLWRDHWPVVDVMVDLKRGGSMAFRPMVLAEMALRSARRATKSAQATFRNSVRNAAHKGADGNAAART